MRCWVRGFKPAARLAVARFERRRNHFPPPFALFATSRDTKLSHYRSWCCVTQKSRHPDRATPQMEKPPAIHRTLKQKDSKRLVSSALLSPLGYLNPQLLNPGSLRPLAGLTRFQHLYVLRLRPGAHRTLSRTRASSFRAGRGRNLHAFLAPGLSVPWILRRVRVPPRALRWAAFPWSRICASGRRPRPRGCRS